MFRDYNFRVIKICHHRNHQPCSKAAFFCKKACQKIVLAFGKWTFVSISTKTGRTHMIHLRVLQQIWWMQLEYFYLLVSITIYTVDMDMAMGTNLIMYGHVHGTCRSMSISMPICMSAYSMPMSVCMCMCMPMTMSIGISVVMPMCILYLCECASACAHPCAWPCQHVYVHAVALKDAKIYMYISEVKFLFMRVNIHLKILTKTNSF